MELQLPLKAEQYREGHVSILHAVKSDSALVVADMVNTRSAKADADYIVRAVNAHDELVAALRELVIEADKTGGRMRQVHRVDVDKARALLARLEGK